MKHLALKPPPAPQGEFIRHLIAPVHDKSECRFGAWDAITAMSLLFGLVLTMRFLVAN
jgi:hypothetical protein